LRGVDTLTRPLLTRVAYALVETSENGQSRTPRFYESVMLDSVSIALARISWNVAMAANDDFPARLQRLSDAAPFLLGELLDIRVVHRSSTQE
jgi:hypothetical protein